MPCSVAFEEGLEAVIVTVRDRLALAEIKAAMREVWQMRRDRRSKRVLWDSRAGSLAALTARHAQEVAAYQAKRQDLPRSRLAILVAREVDFGVARMLSGFIGDEPFECRVFRDEAAARDWLRRGGA